MLYTVFCDESCHLQMDNSSVMVLGAMYCFSEKRKCNSITANRCIFVYLSGTWNFIRICDEDSDGIL